MVEDAVAEVLGFLFQSDVSSVGTAMGLALLFLGVAFFITSKDARQERRERKQAMRRRGQRGRRGRR